MADSLAIHHWSVGGQRSLLFPPSWLLGRASLGIQCFASVGFLLKADFCPNRKLSGAGARSPRKFFALKSGACRRLEGPNPQMDRRAVDGNLFSMDQNFLVFSGLAMLVRLRGNITSPR